MKTIYLLCISVIILFGSCAKTTHFGTMPNQPMFNGAKQAQATVGVGLDHLEAQGAISVLPFLGFTGNVFKGTKNRSFYEYGANLFIPFNKKTFFLSLGAGKGEGKFDGKVTTESAIFGISESYYINSKFSSTYIQPSIYYSIKEKGGYSRFNIGIGVKHEEFSFKKFDISFHSTSGQSYYNYAFYHRAINAHSIMQTTFIAFAYENDREPIYVNAQIGKRNILKQFSTMNYKNTGFAYPSRNPLNGDENLFFQKWMLNLTVGFKIDAAKVKRLLKSL